MTDHLQELRACFGALRVPSVGLLRSVHRHRVEQRDARIHEHAMALAQDFRRVQAAALAIVGDERPSLSTANYGKPKPSGTGTDVSLT